ncbi:unnamed protein product [Lepeophtheirus salmonis]|uniref:(salmon louse) hypothetical protein n=1 Tax=Lepeophtheirus salmonis TaxID=72036 RepID=A0A7R8H1Z0_LEPSM|nr:unnamed protein product [Lepeophtheirus salmonis]CAF2818368.1 unnamed protein product [Lepeophtheirus salmonis]
MEQSYLLIITLFSLSEIYLCDEAPYLQPGGDLIDFQLFENTPPNSVVYTLRGYDPEFGVEGLTYTISGDYFSINQKTGVISLKKKVDREIKEFIRVVVTIQDKGNNLIPFSREIVILDENDNAPNFEREPYNFSINETTPVDTVVYSSILVSDKDSFENAKVKLECVPYDLDDKSCEVFMIQTEEYKAGSYFGTITLKKELNYETKSSYKIKIRAKDLGQPRYLSSATEVFIQLIDVQDQPPFFINSPYFSTIKENIASDTKIFDIQVRDEHFFVLENQYLNEHSISSATLKTAKNVTIDREMRTVIEAGGIYTFQIRAREILDIKQNYGDETYTNVTVIITDEDDSIPIFNKNFLTIAVPEDVRYDTPLPDLNIIVQDNDSSMNAAFELALNRPGPFSVHPKKAIGKTPVILRVSNPELLDYESPGKNNYKIQINAIQNQSILSNCTINIIVTDSNDNAPTFSKDFYQFSVEENAPAGKSIGFITAFDLDSGSFGQVKYNLKGFGADKFRVNDESGELFINTCMTDTQFWRESCLDYETQEFYFLTYTGTDGGNQITATTLHIQIIDVNDNYPKFLDQNYSRTIDEGASEFQPKFIVKALDADGISQGGASVSENAVKGTEVIRISALSNDGIASNVSFKMYSGAKDNFIIDPITGIIRISQDANLDIQENGDNYEIIISASNYELPYSQIVKINVSISIIDVNDKVPIFDQNSYTKYLTEPMIVGTEAIQVSATDADRNAALKYGIIKPVIAIDKAGNLLSNKAKYDFTTTFKINEDNGIIYLNNSLSYNSAAVIILTVEVIDTNAEVNTISETDEHDCFNNQKFESPWTPSSPSLYYHIKEGLKPRTLLFTVNAHDPISKKSNIIFKKSELSDPKDLINLNTNTGEVYNNEIFDFDMNTKEITFTVHAISMTNSTKISEAFVHIEVEDINDNAPEFNQSFYMADLNESALPLTIVLRVKAIDKDSGNFGKIQYSLFGEGSEVFTIHPTEGTLMVKKGPDGRSLIDREKIDRYNLKIICKDMPTGGIDQKVASVEAIINILDSNDESPIFKKTSYSTVIPENSPIGSLVVKINAFDNDLGAAGTVMYHFVDNSLINKIFQINESNGEITTSSLLTGKGRKDPYILYARAADKGEPQLFSDVEVYVTIGDVSDNDGIPTFIKPMIDEIAYNASIGTRVFQAEAEDPDDKNTANGKIIYSLPHDGSIINQLFQIHPESGLLTTIDKLDREERGYYTLILEAKDLGTPSQHTSRTLLVVVKDIDDHKPRFQRQNNYFPNEIEIQEHTNIGTEIMVVKAQDLDEAENAIVDYSIAEGNEGNFFEIFRTDENEGIIFISKEIDREISANFTLIVQCFHPHRNKTEDSENYDRLRVKIIISDIDDNNPKFLKMNLSYGVRVNSAIYTEVAKVKAIDIDVTADPISYQIINITYSRPKTGLFDIIDNELFIIDERTGVIHTNRTLGRFIDGQFVVYVRAINGINRFDIEKLILYVLQDTELLQFVFDQDPASVRQLLPRLKKDIENVFINPLVFNIYDTEFYNKRDGSLDFGRTGSCFQVLNNGKGFLIGFLSILSTFLIFCIYTWHRHHMYRNSPVKIIEATVRTFVHSNLPPGSTINGGGIPSTISSAWSVEAVADYDLINCEEVSSDVNADAVAMSILNWPQYLFVIFRSYLIFTTNFVFAFHDGGPNKIQSGNSFKTPHHHSCTKKIFGYNIDRSYLNDGYNYKGYIVNILDSITSALSERSGNDPVFMLWTIPTTLFAFFRNIIFFGGYSNIDLQIFIILQMIQLMVKP